MNPLEQFIEDRHLNSTEVMNDLTEAGIISDNCIGVEDVADVDCHRALKWLIENL